MKEQHKPLQQYLAEQAGRIEDALKTAIPANWDVPDKLKDAMMYSIEAGGKRLRPVLVLAAAEAVKGDAQASACALPVACAVEMVHTYSLVHDDLPAMDNDDYRRGKLTNHKVFGEAMAILAGDGLLTHAFYVAAQATRQHGVPAETTLAVIEDLARLAGLPGMVGGQAADVLGEQGVTSAEELRSIHLRKTSALISFSLVAGGRIGGADDRQLDALSLFGRNIGLAFQIQDDILDLIGDEQKLGKKVQSDLRQNKVTYPYLLGMDESRKEMARLTAEAKEALARAGLADPGRLLEIADYLMGRDR
ncbi:farnesyl-diphosphate synthase [Paenibacillus cisolokensis]|uniref:Farnesyl-diphosphate synthase n=1 Tax=Paenibacillus cisolokensis TaxID=1658519 RepID=A0ABQ4NCI4_9BACL|nr:farnesyl-diphosphate synthase [Paenibacillus cisolokensis]